MIAPRPPFLNVIAHPSAGTRPVSAYGSPVTPGATNVYGAWADFGVPSTLFDTYLVELFVSNCAVAGQSRCTMLDLGIDVAGGTTFVSIHSSGSLDLVCGMPGAYNDGAANRSTNFRLPIRIPASARIGIRAKQNHATPAALRVALRTRGKPNKPEHMWCGTTIEKFGANAANSQGAAITPGTTSDGAWTAIGAVTTKPIRFLTFGYSIDSAALGGVGYHVDVGYGDATNPILVIPDAHVETSASEAMWHDRPGESCDIPIGSQLYARSQSGTAVVDANHTIALYGIA